MCLCVEQRNLCWITLHVQLVCLRGDTEGSSPSTVTLTSILNYKLFILFSMSSLKSACLQGIESVLVCRTMKMTLRFVMETMTIALMSQNQERKSKNFLLPEKGRYKKFKKPLMPKMKGLVSCLRSCSRSKATWSVSRNRGQVHARGGPGTEAVSSNLGRSQPFPRAEH